MFGRVILRIDKKNPKLYYNFYGKVETPRGAGSGKLDFFVCVILTHFWMLFSLLGTYLAVFSLYTENTE